MGCHSEWPRQTGWQEFHGIRQGQMWILHLGQTSLLQHTGWGLTGRQQLSWKGPAEPYTTEESATCSGSNESSVLGNINRTITNRPKWSLPSVQHPSDYTWKDPGSLLRWEMMAIKQQVDSSNWVYMKTITARTIIRISAITGCGICPWRTELRDLTDESPEQPDLYSVFNLLWAGGWTR